MVAYPVIDIREHFQCCGYYCPKHKDANIFQKPSNPCHVGIHRIALAEYSQMSIHVPGVQSFFDSKFFASFCIGWLRLSKAQGSKYF